MKKAVILKTCLLVLLVSVSKGHATQANSCAARCHAEIPINNSICHCDTSCIRLNDCCDDYLTTDCLGMLACNDRNNENEIFSGVCQSDDLCDECSDECDEDDQISNPEPGIYVISNDDLQDFSEKLIRMDTGSSKDFDFVATVTDPHQSAPFLTIAEATLQKPTIKALRSLYSIYNPDVSVEERWNPWNENTVNQFSTAMYKSPIFQEASTFITQNGFSFDNNNFHQHWFDQYSSDTTGGKLGSSGIEHVFLGELKPNAPCVLGLHNWIYFHSEETATPSRIQYLGTNSTVNINPTKASIIQNSFLWNKRGTWLRKPRASSFVGTSPELELALYTVCLYARPNQLCPMSFYGKKINIKVIENVVNGKTYVKTAYPIL